MWIMATSSGTNAQITALADALETHLQGCGHVHLIGELDWFSGHVTTPLLARINVGSVALPVFYDLQDSENGEILPRTPAATVPGTFDGGHPITTGLLKYYSTNWGSHIVNQPSSVLFDIGDGILLA